MIKDSDPRVTVHTGKVGEDQTEVDTGCSAQIQIKPGGRWYDCGRDHHDYETRHKSTGRYEELRWDDEGNWERRILHD